MLAFWHAKPQGKITKRPSKKRVLLMPNQNKSDLKPLLTIKQVAALENTSERTIRRWIVSGELPAIRTGRMVRVCPDALRAFRLRRLLG